MLLKVAFDCVVEKLGLVLNGTPICSVRNQAFGSPAKLTGGLSTYCMYFNKGSK